MNRKVLALIVAIAALAVITAILLVFLVSGNTAPVPTSTPTSSPAASPSSTPRPTPSETPTPTPADPSASWVFASGSFGPISLGGNGAETAAALGWKPASPSNCVELYSNLEAGIDAGDTRWRIAYGALADDRGIQWIDLRAMGSVENISPSAPRTAENIGIGSTEAEIMAAYPSAGIVTDTGAYREYTVDGGDGTYLHFITGTTSEVFRVITDFRPISSEGSYAC